MSKISKPIKCLKINLCSRSEAVAVADPGIPRSWRWGASPFGPKNYYYHPRNSCGKFVFTDTPLDRHPLGRHPPMPSACQDTHPLADTPRQTPCLGRHPLPSACWDTHPLDRHNQGRHPSAQCMLGYTPPAQSPAQCMMRYLPPPRRPLQRTVRILLECILVWQDFCWKLQENERNWAAESW